MEWSKPLENSHSKILTLSECEEPLIASLMEVRGGWHWTAGIGGLCSIVDSGYATNLEVARANADRFIVMLKPLIGARWGILKRGSASLTLNGRRLAIVSESAEGNAATGSGLMDWAILNTRITGTCRGAPQAQAIAIRELANCPEAARA